MYPPSNDIRWSSFVLLDDNNTRSPDLRREEARPGIKINRIMQ